MKNKIIATLSIDVINKICCFTYALSVANDKIPCMVNKPIIVQVFPMIFFVAIAIWCEVQEGKVEE